MNYVNAEPSRVDNMPIAEVHLIKVDPSALAEASGYAICPDFLYPYQTSLQDSQS
jgi:hypothetical protein